MAKRLLEFEIIKEDSLSNFSNKYYSLVKDCFPNKGKVFELVSGIGRHHEPFTPLGKKKDFISYYKQSDGVLTINTQFYALPEKEKASLKIQVFSNSGEDRLNLFIEKFQKGFKDLNE